MTTYTLDLDSVEFVDKLRGCWLGKNAGGTLGGPLEEAWGHPEPFQVSWYPELREGGIPNDDLEMQLVWLKALEEVGPELTARELARYWLDHIGYNFDEYGMSKTNLRLGLEPPVSGRYNNWFKDYMGAPIRSEIWACVAPGLPRLAVRYAYQDAICDHAGGEGLFGELFHTALEAAAFVVSDVRSLVSIGLSFVPEDSLVANTVRVALEGHGEGLSWQDARKRVLGAAPSEIAQYAPINLGFEVIGWLYGRDFGDQLCTAVNCGYDTDCTGGTLGAILGLILGASNLPEKWIKPLGESIATNESWGGLRHTSDGENPIPANLSELTERVTRCARRVLSAAARLHRGSTITVQEEELYADSSVRDLWRRSPSRVIFKSRDLPVSVDYGDSPAVVPGRQIGVVTLVENPHPDTLSALCTLTPPPGWAAPGPTEVEVGPGGACEVRWVVDIPSRGGLVQDVNVLYLKISAKGRPAEPAVPLVLPGAAVWRISEPRSYGSDLAPAEVLDKHFGPETLLGDPFLASARPGNWREVPAQGNAVDLTGAGTGSCVLYLQTFLHSIAPDRAVWMGADAGCLTRLYVNGTVVAQRVEARPLRPSYAGAQGCYGTCQLREGWNEVLIKLVVEDVTAVRECHLLVSTDDRLHNGITDVGRTRFPWDPE